MPWPTLPLPCLNSSPPLSEQDPLPAAALSAGPRSQGNRPPSPGSPQNPGQVLSIKLQVKGIAHLQNPEAQDIRHQLLQCSLFRKLSPIVKNPPLTPPHPTQNSEGPTPDLIFRTLPHISLPFPLFRGPSCLLGLMGLCSQTTAFFFNDIYLPGTYPVPDLLVFLCSPRMTTLSHWDSLLSFF